MKLLSLIFLLFNLPYLHEAGFTGEGIKIAIIDAGFYRSNDSTVFPQDHILGSYDLLLEDSLSTDTLGMYDDPHNTHGTMCLSTMLYVDSTKGFVGTAPGASYYLIRTEDAYAEYRGEVDRLAKAFYLADSLDADIITVSLGYFRFNNPEEDYTYKDLNGSSTAAQAATEVARRGRLVCASAGNEGNKDWHYITTPGDADSILTVGAVNSFGVAADFSSYGPTADGRQKPEICALGVGASVYKPYNVDDKGIEYGLLHYSNGTSFATPEIAGMAACLWQALPNLTAMELRDLIIRSAQQYPLADDQRGYGIPDAWFAYSGEHKTALTVEEAEDGKVVKRLEDGQIVIIRNGARYGLLGTRLEE